MQLGAATRAAAATSARAGCTDIRTDRLASSLTPIRLSCSDPLFNRSGPPGRLTSREDREDKPAYPSALDAGDSQLPLGVAHENVRGGAYYDRKETEPS